MHASNADAVGRPDLVIGGAGRRLRFDVNLSILFPDTPLLARPAAAAAAGFDAVELWWPFASATPAAREVDDLVDVFREVDVRVVLLNLPTGDPSAGEHGLVALPAERARFRDSVDVAVELVARLNGSILNCHYGNPPPGLTRELLDRTAVESLAFAAGRAAEAGATLVLEALNAADFPRYGLTDLDDAVSLVQRAAVMTRAPVRVLLDVYHVARTGRDVADQIAAHAPHIGHVQIADAPGRGRPGTGAIDVQRVLARLEAIDFRGHVGLEYYPSANPADTFSWLPMALRRAARLPAAGDALP